MGSPGLLQQVLPWTKKPSREGQEGTPCHSPPLPCLLGQ